MTEAFLLQILEVAKRLAVMGLRQREEPILTQCALDLRFGEPLQLEQLEQSANEQFAKIGRLALANSKYKER